MTDRCHVACHAVPLAPAKFLFSLDSGLASAVLPGTSMRVLIVDDEPSVRETLAAVCRDEGHETREAADVFEGLDIWRTWKPSCIFLDLLMPGNPGTDLVRRVRTAGDLTPIVIISGELRSEWVATVRWYGVAAVIQKPFRAEDVLRLLRSLEQDQ